MSDPALKLKEAASKLSPFLDQDFNDPAINEMFQYAMEGGRRVRPSLLLLSGEAVGGDVQKLLPIASSFELLHKFTLVHDDIIDKDEARRDRETLHKKYGLHNGIFMGDFVCSEGFNGLSQLDDSFKTEDLVACYEAYSKTFYDLCVGEFFDVTYPQRNVLTEAEYLNMIYLKSGSIIEAAMRVGALLGGGSKEVIGNLSAFGKHFAYAMQMLNDVKDNLSLESKKLSLKSTDIQENKWSILLIYTLNKLPKLEKESLQKLLQKDTKTDEEIQKIIEHFKKTGAIEYAQTLIQDHFAKARDGISTLPDTDAKKALLALAVVNTDDWYWKANG